MTPTTFEAKVQDFLAQKRIAVAGVSRDNSRHPAANLIYRRLKSTGHDVFPVNPHAQSFDGDRCYPDLQSIPDGVDGVVIVTRPAITERIVRDCSQARVRRVSGRGVKSLIFRILNDHWQPVVAQDSRSDPHRLVFDIKIDDMFREALTERLKNENLLSDGADGSKLVISTKIVEYEKGDAFKRWLLPGWGATVLSVQSDIRDGDRLVGAIEARRTVSAGGGYTVGAWKTIFNSLAEDIVADLRTKIPTLRSADRE